MNTSSLEKYIRAANYLSAIQIYLQDNFLLEEPLRPEHIKERLLGHWGTCPGINFLYAHLNRLITEQDLHMLFVLGPGHGFPAVQANLFLEGTLSTYYPLVSRTTEGMGYMAKQFSWPYGFPSHSNPGAPGVILEGGELGYSLSTAYGSVLDNPDLITVCMVGDGEAETGPLATAWHLNKLVDPAINGVVLPVLHLNGYKISGPTLMGRMSDEELTKLFEGYGYIPHIVDAYTEEHVHERMIEVLDTSLATIRSIQEAARAHTMTDHPRFPMIILRTPKGWGSIPSLHGNRIEDNCLSHQVIADQARTNEEERQALETWLRSYNFSELFGKEGFISEIESLVPNPEHAMGNNPHARGGAPYYKPLALPEVSAYTKSGTCRPEGGSCGDESSMHAVAEFIRDVFTKNSETKNFRLFSPDETYSNKLEPVFEVTKRASLLPLREWDKDIARDGRVIEMLSEHSLQGLMQGYVLTGRHGVFASYEAFVPIIGSMADQYAKFLKIARDIPWRGDVPSLNYILTSGAWRQEHNGFSHQNPGFIDDMLQRQGCYVNVYFPADANTALMAINRSLSSTNEMNVIVMEKRPVPCWRTKEEAARDLEEGIAIWDFASDKDPHFVLCAVGDYLTKETLAALTIIREEIPEMRVRFVNIATLSALGIGNTQCRVLPHDFDYYFTANKPVLINFHGYPQTMKQMLFDYGVDGKRFQICGYEEHGSTTTQFDMHVRNRTDRYNLVIEALRVAELSGLITMKAAAERMHAYKQKLEEHRAYIIEHGTDPEDIINWTWTPRSQ
jgi:xylulose-5-phosphate/fructose-6-phosphate phosphoketolase